MSTDRWMIKKLYYICIYNGILLSHKKECVWVHSNEVDEPRAYYQSEVSQKEKDKCHIIYQFSSVAQLCPTLCSPMECSMPGFLVHHQLQELAQTHVHQVSDAIQPSHPLSSPSPPTFTLSQHQGLFQWVSSSNQVAKVLEFQLQRQSFQWIFRTDFL